jgi:predicted flap endonuclease-1-like 5' DNA nuclease
VTTVSRAEGIPVTADANTTAELDKLRAENANLKTQVAGIPVTSKETTAELDNLRAENARQKSQLDGETTELNSLREENAHLKSQLEGIPVTSNKETTAVVDDVRAENVAPDNLQQINGIGPEIQHRLNAAGIVSFAQLARLTPSQLDNILGEQITNLTDGQDVLNQARRLANLRS